MAMSDLPGSNSYTGFFAGSQAFDVGKLGTQRVGFYAMVGQAPTNYPDAEAACPSRAEASATRASVAKGSYGIFYLGKLDFQVVTQHGSDNAWFGTAHSGGRTDAPSGRCSLGRLERRIRRDPLRVQPAADFHSAVGVGANVAAGDPGHALQPGEH